MGWNIDRFLSKETIVDEFICSICTDVVQAPVQTPCQHLFCEECITRWINEGHRTCPEDRQELTINALQEPSRLSQQFLNKLIVRCKNHSDGCHLMTTYEHLPHLIEHELTQCHVVQNILLQAAWNQFEAEANDLRMRIDFLEKELEY